MKIGTLTVHLPANYGNALQMLSLQRYIISLGHSSQVLNHWCKKNRGEISFWHQYCEASVFNRLMFIVACMTWTFKFFAYKRESKLVRWLEKHIKWSEAKGWGGSFPVSDLKIDALVVGSDQVWNSNCEFVKFFMLPDFADSVKKIAYAASFNSGAFPNEDLEFYKRSFGRFHRISVREASSLPIMERKFGFTPALVCDPSLLHSKEEWINILELKKKKMRPYNVCYIVSPQGRSYYPDLVRLAKETRKKLYVFVYDCMDINIRNHSFFRTIFSMIYSRVKLFLSGVRLRLSADPTDFVQYLSACDTLFTDSFHGLMFGTIFEKKCNVVIGSDKDRQDMKAKLVDFINNYCDKSMLSEKFDPLAAKPVFISPNLSAFISYSKKWLQEAIGK